jgi:hypothetical protein
VSIILTPVALRQTIAGALDGIGAVGDLVVHGYDAEPANPTAGSAWPVFREINPGVLCGGLAYTYDVYAIVRAASPAVSATDAEALAEPLLAALAPIGDWVAPIDAVQIQVADGQTMPALRARITPYR